MKLANENLCTGCAACVNACPFDAISMQSDAEGFLQPIVDSIKCKNCGKCERACPIISSIPKPLQIEKHPLCGASSSDEIWRASASGGAFSEICLALDDKNPVIFGARFDGSARVIHDSVEGAAAIAPFRKSKYVQSDIGYSFRACRARLEEGRMVIFAATPCQIAGLRGYLGRDYDKLVTLEFICHGSGSPGFFKAWLDEIERKFGKKIAEYGFRFKAISGKNREEYTSFYRFCDNTEKVLPRDLYNRFFLNQLCLRKSCMENCPFRNEARYADITYADCRGEKSLYPDKDDKNWSVIIANTEKGKMVVEELKARMELRDYPCELLRATNPLYYRTTPGNPKRDEFFERYVAGERIHTIAKQLVPDPRDNKLRYFVSICWHKMCRFVPGLKLVDSIRISLKRRN